MSDLQRPASPRSAHHEPLLKTVLKSRLVTAFSAVAALLGFGTLGYWFLGRLHYVGVLTPTIETPWSLLDCLYMTVITVSTIGYGETLPSLESLPIVRIYTIGLILTAMILVAFAVSSATAFLVDGDLQRMLLRRRTMNEISRLKGHYIVCGCGVTGGVIIEELVSLSLRVVVIDVDETRLEPIRELRGVNTILGDATSDEILLEAGVENAAGLAIALRDDKDNVFVIISVRQLNPGIRIVSQASATDVQSKLLRAGADSAVASSYVGGLRLVSQLIRPEVVTFLDLMLRQKDSAVRFAEVEIGPDWSGRALGDLEIERKVGLPILAIKQPGDTPFVFNPPPDLMLQEHAKIITMGEVARVNQLEQLVGDPDGATILGAPEEEVMPDPVGDT
ncbi:MAG: potassium channel protein [Planctomycetes bacterium]|nr:potassium channel protein [Planctomycetota bacterium]